MLILITYDVSTMDIEGPTRLRKVAKVCTNYGQRVQNSVFECSVDPAQVVTIKNELKKIINTEEDSIRIYYLGKNWKRRIETMGKNENYDADEGFLCV